jgi:uncharacterized protein with PIN domain
MKKNNTIADIQAQIAALKEQADKKAEKKEEDVCPECGGDLEYVEDGVVYCSHCKQYYDIEEEE